MTTRTSPERAAIRVIDAAENNLRDVSVSLPPGLSAIVGVSGSGKSSLAFDTIYGEARRRYFETLSLGSPWLRTRPARVRRIDGLGPAVAVAQNVLNRNPNSTVATASGIHPYLRVLFARFGERRCAACGAETAITSLEQQLAILRDLAAASRAPVEVIAPIVRRTEGSHRRLLSWLVERWDPGEITVDGRRWRGGTLDPNDEHDIEVRIASVTHETDARDLRVALERTRDLGSSQVVLRTGTERRSLSRSALCPSCASPFEILGAEDFNRGVAAVETYRLGGYTLPELLRMDVAAAGTAVTRLALTGGPRTASDQVSRRLEALAAVGLGYLSLDRPSPSLSRGEAQRLRIALILANPIEDLLHVLDEPTIGLDPAQMAGILSQVARLRGPVIMVEHDRWAVAAADQVIELGPGAGPAGGRVVFEGPPAALWRARTASGAWFSRRERLPTRTVREAPTDWLRVHGASLNNLRDLDVPIPVARLTVVAGPSGAGKTTLVRDVLVGSLETRRPHGCTAIEGPRLRPVTITQEPIGRNARSSAATYSGLADRIRRLFAEATGEPSARFSFNRPEGACPACEGIGAVEIKLPYVPSEWLTCEACDGRRFRPEVLEAAIRLGDGEARSIADVYALPVDAVADLFTDGAALRILESLRAVGLGYLGLGQPSPTLSGGEAQRVKLAKWLSTARPGDLVALDEPTTGLHPADVGRLIEVLHGLVERGSTVVVVEHQPDLIAAADWLVRLGPGGGPDGGRLEYAGPPAHAATGAPAARPRRAPRRRPRASEAITITGASANNLKDVSVAIPKRAITGVVGVSGSGKSSLVRDVLEAEAFRRFVESLSMYERQSIREGAVPPARRIDGLGPTIAISGERGDRSALATVGLATELSFHLGVLLAFTGTRTCDRCGGPQRRTAGGAGQPWRCERCGATGPAAEPAHFSASTYAAACLGCQGVGTIARPALDRLIVEPDAPILAGAMYSPGYFPQGYLSKPDSLGYWMLQGIAQRYGFDPFTTSWRRMGKRARNAFLDADEEVEVDIPAGSGRRSGHHTLRWRGVLRILAGWDLGGLYVDHVACDACGGGRLRPEFLAVRLGTMNRHDLHTTPIRALEPVLDALRLPADVPYWVPQSRDLAYRRVGFLRRVGLGHLHLDRLSRTLSTGEAQRVRLASLLGAELSGMTVLLDEPSRGLHAQEVDALADAVAELRDARNTVVLVDHDPALIDRVDHLVVVGPGAGTQGGRVIAAGPAGSVRRKRGGAAAGILALPRPARASGPRRSPSGAMVVRRPTENNLDGSDVEIPLGVLVGLCGVSGSGKSTLAIDIVARSLAPARLTTSVAYDDIRPGAHDGIDGAPGRVIQSTQSRSGIQNPGAFFGIIGPIRRAYAESAEAAVRGLDGDALTPDCDGCNGHGTIHEEMGFLPSIVRSCDACDGTGYRLEVRELAVRGEGLGGLARRTLDEILERWGDVEPIGRALETAASLGLGYLTLGQPSHSLSGGEAQRLKLARELARRARQPTLFILDEPTAGLHARDVARLADVLDTLVDRGHSVLVVEHDPVFLACCDRLLELGPGGGPDGGHLIAAGTPEEVADCDTPTARYLRAALA